MVVRLVRGFYNEQNNTVNVIHYDDNTIISLDCGKWEQGLRTTPNSQGRMDARVFCQIRILGYPVQNAVLVRGLCTLNGCTRTNINSTCFIEGNRFT